MRRLSALPEDDPGRRREEQRVAAIGREYRAKLDDLARQYAMRVTVAWVQTLELVMPVHRFAVQIRRRKAQRMIHLDWNPLARRLEPPACEFSRAAERPRLVATTRCISSRRRGSRLAPVAASRSAAPATGSGVQSVRACRAALLSRIGRGHR